MLRRIGDGEIVDGQGQAVHYYTPYRPQQWLWYYRRAENEVAVPFAMPILYADDYLVAVDKPHFLPSIPSGQYLEHTRSEEHTSELQSRGHLVCRLLLAKNN